MPGIVRFPDVCTGHGCFPPRMNAGGSSNVFADGLSVHRLGDPWLPHCCPDHGCHGSVQASGSPNVNANGMPVARIGDVIACGSSNATGSSSVIVN